MSYNYGVWSSSTEDVEEKMEEFKGRMEAEIAFNLEVENSLRWRDGDVAVSVEKEYE